VSPAVVGVRAAAAAGTLQPGRRLRPGDDGLGPAFGVLVEGAGLLVPGDGDGAADERVVDDAVPDGHASSFQQQAVVADLGLVLFRRRPGRLGLVDDGTGRDPVDLRLAEVDVAAACVGGVVDGLAVGDRVAALLRAVAAHVEPELAGA